MLSCCLQKCRSYLFVSSSVELKKQIEVIAEVLGIRRTRALSARDDVGLIMRQEGYLIRQVRATFDKRDK
jgi:hypothetical protein